MAILIQSLSWALIYSLAQGFVVYATLLLVLKIVRGMSASSKYRLSLSALTIMLGWFAATWWQQYHLWYLDNGQTFAAQVPAAITNQLLLHDNRILAGNPLLLSLPTVVEVIVSWFPLFYATGLVLMLTRLLLGVRQLVSFKTTGVSLPDAVFTDMLDSLKTKLHFKRSVQLLISAKATVPMVIGFLKPIILLPAATLVQLSTDQLESILLHEMAHIKRFDYLINILQTIVETVLFFNPFVWLASSIARRERELCCDDLVLAHSNGPLYYATALAALASQSDRPYPSFTVAATGQPDHLFNRIKRIVEMKKNPFSYSRMIAAILIISAIACSVAWLAPAFAPSGKSNMNVATAIPLSSVPQQPVSAEDQETTDLVQRLAKDHLVDESKGYIVEKRQNALYLNNKQQPDDIAHKYLSGLKQEAIYIKVLSFSDRLMKHPDASILQIASPVLMNSGCVDRGKKPGC